MSQETMTPEQYRAYKASGKKKVDNTKRGNKAKGNMHWVLVDLSRRHDLLLIQEYQFNPARKWRTDWALKGNKGEREIRILIEYEGLGYGKTGHTDSKGYSKDAEKYNSAQALEWIVLRYTFLTYENLSRDLQSIFKQQPDAPHLDKEAL